MNSRKSAWVMVPSGLRAALMLRTPGWKWLRITVWSPSSAADQPGQRFIDHQADEKTSCLSVHLCRDMLAVSVIDLHSPIRFSTLPSSRGRLGPLTHFRLPGEFRLSLNRPAEADHIAVVVDYFKRPQSIRIIAKLLIKLHVSPSELRVQTIRIVDVHVSVPTRPFMP
jgi:hypothetical protein